MNRNISIPNKPTTTIFINIIIITIPILITVHCLQHRSDHTAQIYPDQTRNNTNILSYRHAPSRPVAYCVLSFT